MWMFRLRKLLKSVGREGLILFFAVRHPRTHPGLRLATAALLVYVLSPVDLLPDLAPVLGWIDDATLLLLGIPFLLKRMPADILADATQAAERLSMRLRGLRGAR